MLYLAAIFIVFIGFAHSYLGERYILIRLFRRDNLPKLFGSPEFTQNTLRFAWHLTSVAWFGFAAILMILASDNKHLSTITTIIAITFLIHAVITLLASKGKHFAWPIFLIIGLATLFS